MSNLNSVFDTLRGYPDGHALVDSFMPKSGETLVEGTIVKIADSGNPLKPHVEALSSAVKAGNPKDDAWVVIQGNDQFDALFVNKVTCLKLGTGGMIKLASTIANTLAPGDVVSANAGVLEKTVAGAGMKWHVGQVIESNNTAGATGWVTIAP